MSARSLLRYSPLITRAIRTSYPHPFIYHTGIRFASDSSTGGSGGGKHEGLPGYNDPHQGTFARTDKEVVIEHPPEENLPRSIPYQGRGGVHNRRTLAAFSLEDRVGVVTGGARGLGLVMAQALVISGANVALVDLNSKSVALSLVQKDAYTAA